MCVHRLGCCRGGRGMLPTEVGQAASEAEESYFYTLLDEQRS